MQKFATVETLYLISLRLEKAKKTFDYQILTEVFEEKCF